MCQGEIQGAGVRIYAREPKPGCFRRCALNDCALQPDDPHEGFELHSHWHAVPTILKKQRELFHRESGLSNQRSKGSFGQLLFRNALTASLPETTGNFIRRQPQ